MNVIIDDTFTLYFTTSQFSTGTEMDADETPTIGIYEQGVLISPTHGSVTSLGTGVYSVTIPMTALAGFEVGKTYGIVVQATVGSVVCHKVESVHILPNPATATDATAIQSSISDLSTSVGQVLKWLRNLFTKVGTILTLYDDDGETPLYTQTYSRTDEGFTRGPAQDA